MAAEGGDGGVVKAEGIENAAWTCFLENLAKQSHPLHSLLRGEVLAYWSA